MRQVIYRNTTKQVYAVCASHSFPFISQANLIDMLNLKIELRDFTVAIGLKTHQHGLTDIDYHHVVKYTKAIKATKLGGTIALTKDDTTIHGNTYAVFSHITKHLPSTRTSLFHMYQALKNNNTYYNYKLTDKKGTLIDMYPHDQSCKLLPTRTDHVL